MEAEALGAGQLKQPLVEALLVEAAAPMQAAGQLKQPLAWQLMEAPLVEAAAPMPAARQLKQPLAWQAPLVEAATPTRPDAAEATAGGATGGGAAAGDVRSNMLLIHYTGARDYVHTSEHVSREATPASGLRSIARLEWPSAKVRSANTDRHCQELGDGFHERGNHAPS